jgi:ligand-binding sensor domain-containing protein
MKALRRPSFLFLCTLFYGATAQTQISPRLPQLRHITFEEQYPSLTRTYHFEHLSTEQGLSNKFCHALLVDNEGVLWIGTDDGLNRYDGRSIIVYRNIASDSTSLSGNVIWSLLEDRFGTLWIGTQGAGLSKYDRIHNSFIGYRSDPADSSSLADDVVNTLGILEDTKGSLWIWTDGTVPHPDGRYWMNLLVRNQGLLDPDHRSGRQSRHIISHV